MPGARHVWILTRVVWAKDTLLLGLRLLGGSLRVRELSFESRDTRVLVCSLCSGRAQSALESRHARVERAFRAGQSGL